VQVSDMGRRTTTPQEFKQDQSVGASGVLLPPSVQRIRTTSRRVVSQNTVRLCNAPSSKRVNWTILQCAKR
jgi:hypothetical protein